MVHKLSHGHEKFLGIQEMSAGPRKLSKTEKNGITDDEWLAIDTLCDNGTTAKNKYGNGYGQVYWSNKGLKMEVETR